MLGVSLPLPFTLFSDAHRRTREPIGKVSAALRARLAKAVSTEFAEWLREEQLCRYEQGLFWLVDGKEHTRHFGAMGRSTAGVVPLVCGAFGDLLLCGGGQCQHYYTADDQLFGIGGGDAVKYLFTFQLTDRGFVSKHFNRRLFLAAVEAHGPLPEGHVFERSPALPAKASLSAVVKGLSIVPLKRFHERLEARRARGAGDRRRHGPDESPQFTTRSKRA